MVNRTITAGDEGRYNLIDWRSWKLARVARSSLSAESQPTAEAADALLFTCLFWRLIFNPQLPIDSDTSAQLRHPPAHVVDAKALYDLLIKDEIQAALGSDKRTAVETLVAQDKLKVCRAQVKWVSSEKQYADGMTKCEGGQLLADRLRSHQMRLTSDTSFQAAKKKTAFQRKKGEELYAIKKPSKSLQAIAAAASTITTTHAMHPHHNNNELQLDDSFTWTNLLLTFVFLMAFAHGLHLLPHFYNFTLNLYNQLRHWLRGPDEPEPEEEDPEDLLLLEQPRDQGGIIQLFKVNLEYNLLMEWNSLQYSCLQDTMMENLMNLHCLEKTQWPIWKTWWSTFVNNWGWRMRTTSATMPNCKNFYKSMSSWLNSWQHLAVWLEISTWIARWRSIKQNNKYISSNSRFRTSWTRGLTNFWIAMSSSHQEENAGTFLKLAQGQERILRCLEDVHAEFVSMRFKFNNKNQSHEPEISTTTFWPDLADSSSSMWSLVVDLRISFNFHFSFHQCELCCQHKAYHALDVSLMAILAVCHQLGWVGLTEPLLRIANANGKQIAAYFVRRIFAQRLAPLVSEHSWSVATQLTSANWKDIQ